MAFKFWFLVFPDLHKAVGGIKQIHRVAEQLIHLGHDVCLIQDDASFHPSWFRSSNVPTISKNDWFENQKLSANFDIIVIPETFLSILPQLPTGIPIVIFNQNASYSFGLPGKTTFKPSYVIPLYSHPVIKQVWCVSEHDRRLLTQGFSLEFDRVKLLVNSIETDKCLWQPPCNNQIAYMTRKNIVDHMVVIEMLQHQSWLSNWKLVPIQDMSHDQVISVLQQSSIFLSFGFPEGFGLPVAEALACGCALVGYSGLGGRELFEIASRFDLSYDVEFGDWLGFLSGLQKVVNFHKLHFDEFNFLSKRVSSEIRHAYSPSLLQESLSDAIRHL